VQLTVTLPHTPPTVKPERFSGRLTRTPAGWKLSALSQVPVGAASSAGTGR
jgi:Mce-associated membrane protein